MRAGRRRCQQRRWRMRGWASRWEKWACRWCVQQTENFAETMRLAGRTRNDPESGLASPNHQEKLSEPLLGCIEVDFCNKMVTKSLFYRIFFRSSNFCTVFSSGVVGWLFQALIQLGFQLLHGSRLRICRFCINLFWQNQNGEIIGTKSCKTKFWISAKVVYFSSRFSQDRFGIAGNSRLPNGTELSSTEKEREQFEIFCKLSQKKT